LPRINTDNTDLEIAKRELTADFAWMGADQAKRKTGNLTAKEAKSAKEYKA
jgi:hypothetical protein